MKKFGNVSIKLANNTTVRKIAALVPDEFYTFKEFESTDFTVDRKIKPAGMVGRYVEWNMHLGKSLEESFLEAIKITTSVRSYKEIIKKYVHELKALMDERDYYVRNFSMELIKMLLQKKSQWLILQFLRGKLVRCKECGKVFYAGNSNKQFCSRSCGNAYTHELTKKLEADPEISKLADEFISKPKTVDTHSKNFYRKLETNPAFLQFVAARTRFGSNPNDSDRLIYKEYRNYLASTGSTEKELSSKIKFNSHTQSELVKMLVDAFKSGKLSEKFKTANISVAAA